MMRPEQVIAGFVAGALFIGALYLEAEACKELMTGAETNKWATNAVGGLVAALAGWFSLEYALNGRVRAKV